MKYSGMAFQMGAIILIGTYFGRYLDQQFEIQRPYLTTLFALVSIFAALYISLKDIIQGK